MDNMQPCPFCGGNAKLFGFSNKHMFYPIDEALGLNYYSVRCVNCHCGTGLYRSLDRAIATWNRRDDNGE